MELYENKDQKIKCPQCGCFLTFSDKRDGRIHKLACKRCNKWIWFKPNNPNDMEIKEIPKRCQSSGMVFY